MTKNVTAFSLRRVDCELCDYFESVAILRQRKNKTQMIAMLTCSETMACCGSDHITISVLPKVPTSFFRRLDFNRTLLEAFDRAIRNQGYEDTGAIFSFMPNTKQALRAIKEWNKKNKDRGVRWEVNPVNQDHEQPWIGVFRITRRGQESTRNRDDEYYRNDDYNYEDDDDY